MDIRKIYDRFALCLKVVSAVDREAPGGCGFYYEQ